MRLTLIIFLLLILSTPYAAAASGDTVILLHGIGRSKIAMEKMEKDLVAKGYAVVNIGYASRKKSIEDLATDVRDEIRQHHINPAKKLHFVGHSMGGLVIRAYIAKYHPKNLERVVMLGTPNQGSEIADLLHKNALYVWYYGPAGQELVTDRKKFSKIFGKINYDLGVIAGDRSIDPISSLLILPGKDDGKVTVERTKIKGMKDHIVIHATHTFMPSNDDVIRQTEYFLEHGKFDHLPGTRRMEILK